MTPPAARPLLTAATPAEDFESFYWLRDELIAFCRMQELPTGGAKTDLAARVAAYLRGEPLPELPDPLPKTRATALPAELHRDTVIGVGWSCNQALRAFFQHELGPGFHFNGPLRAFIREGVGHTLGEALTVWQTAQATPPGTTPIAPQFEYNRYIRAYFRAHPGATQQEAIAAWRAHRAERRPD